MRKVQFVLLFVFCVILFGGMLVTFVTPEQETSVLENRDLAQHPEFSVKTFLKGKYQKQYETYLSDQFPMRDQWVDCSCEMQAAMGKKDINGVYLGKEGYLLEDLKEMDVDEEQIEDNTEYLSSFLNDMEQAYGKDHVSCVMIPSKVHALVERLPAYAEIPDRDGVLEPLRSRLSYPDMLIDLKDMLREHQKEYIYYRTDHHWTTLGAYYAYGMWAEYTGQATVFPLEHYDRETVFGDFYGTTYNKAHVRVTADRVELFHNGAEEGIYVSMDGGEAEADTMYFPEEALDGFNRYNVFFSKNTFRIEVTTRAKTGKQMLLIKDSFANCFVPFLTEDYDRIVMIDYRYGKTPMGEILSEYEGITDVLVLFNTEKFMQNTKLDKLADTRREGEQSETMEEFHLEDFLE